ncbi:MAG: helix-hairpin-helix domain-containing protein [Candidatus Cloacimonetes bacterium]|nr:helix-hairpin-helix domain-containing protein [Candidatus Cloacimonadota bacterium]
MNKILYRLLVCFYILAFIELNTLETDADESLPDYHQELTENPLGINHASKEELSQIPGLTNKEINYIISYRKKHHISDKQDLLRLGISEIKVEEISNMIRFEKLITKSFSWISLWKFELSKADYRSPIRSYQKGEAEWGCFQAGFLADKDPGESRLTDFYSWHLMYKGEGILRRILIGKYQISWGLGLLFSSPLGSPRSYLTSGLSLKAGNVIKPYRSSFECWEEQGTSVSIGWKNFTSDLFYSVNNLDIRADSSGITSFDESGLHLDNKTILAKKAIMGGNLQFRTKTLALGLTTTNIEFSKPFSNPEFPQKYLAVSLFSNWEKDRFSVQSELLYLASRWLGLASMRFRSENLTQLLLIRYYPNDIPSWQSNSIAVKKPLGNEQGIIYGVELALLRDLTALFYVDLWEHPQTRYYEKMPTRGREFYLQLKWYRKPDQIKLIMRQKNKEVYTSSEGKTIREVRQQTYRLEWQHYFKTIEFKTRIEFGCEYYPASGSYRKGLLISSNISWKYSFWKINAQFLPYHADILMYPYFYDVTSQGSSRGINGDGLYTAVILQFKILPGMSLETRYSQEFGKSDSKAFSVRTQLNF